MSGRRRLGGRPLAGCVGVGAGDRAQQSPRWQGQSLAGHQGPLSRDGAKRGPGVGWVTPGQGSHGFKLAFSQVVTLSGREARGEGQVKFDGLLLFGNREGDPGLPLGYWISSGAGALI